MTLPQRADDTDVEFREADIVLKAEKAEVDFSGFIRDWVKVVRQVRAKLAHHDFPSNYTLKFSCSGYATHSDMELTIHLFSYHKGKSVDVQGRKVEVVIEEFLRRCGYEEQENVLLLTN